MDSLWIVASLLALAVLLLWLASRLRRRLGLPGGRLLYRDMDASDALRRPLYAADLDLIGRPDYLLRNSAGLVPVEVKSGCTPRQPHEAHIYQLAAYCALVERHYGQRPQMGIIRYPQRRFEVDYTPTLENQLIALLDEMRADLESVEVHRSHQQVARCQACGYLDLCDQSL